MEEQKIKNLNVFLLGLAFMLVFTAFQTIGNVQTVILDSAKNETSDGYVPDFHGDGFTSLAIIYAVFSLANWFAPPVVSWMGPRFTLIAGGVCYALFIAQLTYPNDFMLYGASALIGLGAAMIWVAQGNFLTLNSDESTNERNSGIFWAMLQCSMIIGNTFVYFVFRGKSDIDTQTRLLVALVLLGVCVVGVLVFLALRPTPWASGTDTAASSTPIAVFKGSLRLLITPNMMFLTVTFAYTGLMLTFWSGVYGASIGFTKQFGDDAKSLNGLHGIIVGLGEITGGLAFGIFGKYLARFGRHFVVILGFIVHVGAGLIAFLDLPFDAPKGETNSESIIMPINPYLVIFGSYLLGLGDACYNTQIYSLIGSAFKDESASAFAIFKFFQSAFAAAAFFYSNQIDLPYQLIVLGILCILGTVTFCIVELKTRRLQSYQMSNNDHRQPSDEAPVEEDNSCGVTSEETNQSPVEEEVKA